MAKRLSVKEMLEAARKGGPAKPADPDATPPPAEAAAESAPAPEMAAESAPAASEPEPAPPPAPTPASLGRPLTLKEKLAAARAGGAPPPPKPAVASAESAAVPAEESAAAESPAVAPPPQAPPPAAAPLGRPMTLKEKLAAARSGAAGGGAGAPAPAAARPTAATAGAAAAKAAAPRALPPLEKITDPKDLAEALRQSGAKKAKETAAAAASKGAEAAGATPAKAASAAKAAGREKDAKPQTVLPKPKKGTAAATAAGAATSRRGFMLGPLFISWVLLGWASFVAGCSLFTLMLGRFMFPNVLAEPPSTIKVGLPTNFEPEEVNERFKAEWGFWIVRSTRYNGEDIIYALQSVCTHLGCPPNWLAGEQKFKCPCHGSGFYISGVNFEGPAPRPLERFKVTLADDGQMVVDKSQKYQQELGQWSEPESYITA